MSQFNIGFIGGGNMARAIISGLVKSGYDKCKIIVSNRSEGKLLALKEDFGVQTTLKNSEVVKNADIIVLAVKPQFMADALNNLKSEISDLGEKLIISLAAGVTIARLTELMNGHKKIIRLMPNTPALIGFGVTGCFASDDVSSDDKEITNKILSSIGKTVWVAKESDINIITAASGSSPAYFFIFMQYMIEHAINLGLTEEQAKTLVIETAIGSSQMVVKNPNISLEKLREQVTSKGGTTFAAISKFEELNLKNTIEEGMNACISRAEEMQKLF